MHRFAIQSKQFESFFFIYIKSLFLKSTKNIEVVTIEGILFAIFRMIHIYSDTRLCKIFNE